MKDPMAIEYEVTPGKMVRGLTIGVILLFIALGVGIPLLIYYIDGMGFVLMLTTVFQVALFLVILLLSLAYSPRFYLLSEKGVTIDMPIKPVSIPIGTITKVEERDFKAHKLVKKWGNSGLFSISGNFWDKAEGNMKFYAKNNNYVMIYAEHKYVLSPDDRFLFVSHLRNYVEKRGKKEE